MTEAVSSKQSENTRQIVLAIGIDKDGFEFASSLDSAILHADGELVQLSETIQTVDSLKPDCDKLDYALAASAGALCGLMDIFLVGKPGETKLGEMTDGWFEDRVTDFAKLCGWDGKDTASAIRYLEQKFKIPYDQTGRGIASEIFDLTPENHHFKSLGHNPTLFGLFFSILDQFTNQSHFVTDGELVALQDADGGFELRGNNAPAKLFCGFFNWFGHLISDMSGSSGSKGRGMGVPSPFWAWTSDIVAIRRQLGIDVTDFDKNLSELALNVYKQGFDLRFQAVQAIPVLFNEAVVRLLYAVRRLVRYLKKSNRQDRSFQGMWSACEPFSNPTIKRMLTVAHGTFCMLDVGDAIARGIAAGAGTFNAAEFVMRLNIAGVGRFSISLYGETKRAFEINSARQSALFAQREQTIVEDYLSGLHRLAQVYDDERLVCFVDDFRCSDMYIEAFEKSVQLAEMRKVDRDKLLKTKTDIDEYFAGGRK